MKTKHYILIIAILLLLSAAIFIVVSSIKVEITQDNNFYQTVNNNIIEDYETKQRIVFTKGTIEQYDNEYLLTMTVTNNGQAEIDMSNYRIALYPEQGEEIDWFRGDVIGSLKPGKSVTFSYLSYEDISKTVIIGYEVFNFTE